MKPLHLALTILFAGALLSLVVWLGRPQGSSPSNTPAPAAPTTPADPAAATEGLPIPEQGPYGKAVVDETTFDFGALEKGGKGSHVFTIRNEGPGPLRVLDGKTSCGQCTFGSVSPKNEDIPPGGTATVEIKWDIKSPSPSFRQTADVYTTDPENKKIVFSIQGRVDTVLRMVPDGTWAIGDLSDSQPTTIEGKLYSAIEDNVTIDRVEVSNPLITVTWEKSDPEGLGDRRARSGVLLKVTIAPGKTVGPFRETVKLFTPVRGGTEVEIGLSGNRPGPIEIKGRGFRSENNFATLGEFDAEKGQKAKLLMYVRNQEGELQAEQVETPESRVKVRVTPTGRSFGSARVYDVEIEVPPGPPAMRRHRESEPVVLKMNHPEITEFKMNVDYHAR